jgi:hypothetical protein
MEKSDISYSFYLDKSTETIESKEDYDEDEIIVNNYKKICSSEQKEKKIKPESFVKSPPDPFRQLTEINREKWVDDNSVSQCQGCHATFRIYRRRHHCISEGTKITLADSKCVNIENVHIGEFLPSWNKKEGYIDLGQKRVVEVFDQGLEKCMKLTLEDSRTLIATEDHKILCISKDDKTPKYRMMKDLNSEYKIVCSLIEGKNMRKTEDKYEINIESEMEYSLYSSYSNYKKLSGNEIDYEQYKKNIQLNEYKYYYLLRIVSIENLDEEFHVYDLNISDNHSFIANGIVVHNCRNCCDVFCDSCTSYREKIPRVIKKLPTRTGKEEAIDYNNPVRLCKKCHTSYTFMHKLEKLFIIFSLLDLTLADFKKIALVCKQWNLISAFYLSSFRKIQYKLPNTKLNEWEKKALWNNRHILKGHNIWEIEVLRSVTGKKEFNELVNLYFPSISPSMCNQIDQTACWQRMCSRYCNKYLDDERSILLLETLVNKNETRDINYFSAINILSKEICKCLNIYSDEILECYLPYILHILSQANNIELKNFLLMRAEKSIRIANILYWYFKNNNRIYLSELIEKIPQDYFATILKGDNFLEIIKNSNIVEDIFSGFEHEKIVSPVNPEKGEQKIYTEKVSIKESATRPMVIPLDKSCLLYKKDDIRKDYVIMCVIRLMQIYLKREGLLTDIDLVTYNIQPTSENEGFIQMVPNAETLYALSEKHKTTIINYLLDNNPDKTVSNLRNRFKESCAVYSVIAFLLSINDRNTENLMVTKDGDFFHIDFAQILSQNSKPLKASCMRITTQMVDALGGEKSKDYAHFKEICYKVYDILRRHIKTFICILSVLPTYKSNSLTSPTCDEQKMMEELIKRFCPGERSENAEKILHTKIEDSASNSTFSKDSVIDFCHHYAKVSNSGSVSDLLSNTYINTYDNTKWLLSSMYSYLPSFK